MLSYWGDHGLGDWSRIPLGHGKQVAQIDGTRAFIQNTNYEKGNGISIEKFQITNNFLCGKTQENYSKYPGDYFVFDLKNNDVIFFKDHSKYEIYSEINNLPLTNKFKDFNCHYKKYWHGWRFWLLA